MTSGARSISFAGRGKVLCFLNCLGDGTNGSERARYMCSVDDPMIVGDGARGAVASILGISGGRRELSGPWAQARRCDRELFEERNLGEGRSDACRRVYATHTAARVGG